MSSADIHKVLVSQLPRFYLLHFALEWNDRTDAFWSSKSSIDGEAFRRASPTRPLINGQHDCVKANGHHFEHLLWTTGSFQSHPTTKQALIRATHSLPKKTLCLACGKVI